MSFGKQYRQGIYLFGRGFCLFFIVISLIFSLATTVDLTFGLEWGYAWVGIPAGVGFAAFGLMMYWVVGKIYRILEGHYNYLDRRG